MNISGTIGLKVFLSALALAGGGFAFAAPANGAATGAAMQPTHSTNQTLPAALRPVFYQSLAKDAGAAYNVNTKGCATLPQSSLTACFDAAGAHFNAKGAAPLALHLLGFGRGKTLAPVSQVQPAITGNQVRYTHGALNEWWRVLPVGFEQGFTVNKRPGGAGELVLALGANNKASRQDAGAPDGTLAFGKLRYGQLVVTDANDKVVPATLKNEGDRILIAVNDAHAAYPLTVDPLVWLEQKVIASDGAAGDRFGFSVALSGSTALVGAPNATVNGNQYQGAAYVFSESGGTWSQTAKLTASDGAAYDFFGISVAVSGSTAIVCAENATVNGNGSQGAAYVFSDSGGTWSQTAKLTASDGATGDAFGSSVVLVGSTALVGAVNATVNGNFAQGAAYVFSDSGGTWSQTAKLTASDGAANDQFGFSVALSGSTALVGAYRATVNGNSAQGAAYVFTESGDTWAQSQKLTANDGAAYDFFGFSVAVSGSTAIVCAEGATVNGNGGQGAAYVFSDSGGAWSQTAKLTASDGAGSAQFGYSVALSGSTALVGAFNATVNGNLAQGAAYVFSDSGGTWSQTVKLTASDGAGGAQFGYSVALSGSTALVGAEGATVNGNGGQGTAYFYGERDLDLLTTAPGSVYRYSDYSSQTIATNSSSVVSPAVAVTVAVPAAASFISAISTQGSCSQTSGLVTCNLGSIGAGGFAMTSVTLAATGNGGTTIENTASVVATPKLSDTAPTLIRACLAGYTEYDGTLGAGQTFRTPTYEAPAGEEFGILAAPVDFQLYVGYRKEDHAKWNIRLAPGHLFDGNGPAGTYGWAIKAGTGSGTYSLCIQHP
ncbi:MAG: hypothetical protein ACRES7_01475 [Gammaproteobacteria bacterium]